MAKDDDDGGGDLKSLIMKARQGPLNFGLCLGGKPEETVFNANRKKSPDVLEREAKKEGGSIKTVGGSFVVEGTEAKLTCLGDAPAGTAKKLSVFFKKVVGIKLKVILLDPTGLTLDSGDADEEGEEGQAPPAAPPAPPVDASAVTARFDAALKRLLPAVQAAIAASPAARDVLLQLVSAVRTAAAGGNEAEAKARTEQLVAVLGKLGVTGAAPAPAAAAAGGVSLVKLGKARLEWADARVQGVSGIQRLKVAIQEDYADMPEAGDAVRAALGRLDKLVGQIDDRLVDELDAVLNAPAEARGPLADRARSTIAGFSAVVDKDPILAALDGNEFVPELSVVAPLRARLAAISAALG
jgi:hypothetical protein